MTEPITQPQARMIAKEAAQEAIHETFALMGVDVHEIESMNKFRDDLIWIRRYRRMSESVGSRIVVVITTALTGGILAAIWFYIKDAMGD